LFIVLATMLFMLLNTQKPPRQSKTAASPPPPPSMSSEELIGYAGLAVAGVMMIGGLVLTIQLSRRLARVRARRSSFRFDDDGLTQVKPGIEQTWPWSHFHSFAETDNLFVIRYSRAEGWTIPKRLFATATELLAFREMLVARLVRPAETNAGELDYYTP
jgi:hypothetical protein